MATVDYHQIAEDHQSFLVLIRHAGKQLSWKQFSRCWERVCHNTCVAVPGQKRDMWIRYRRSYSKENNEWGDIQAHRKVLGLICIGKCNNEIEFEELFQSYKHEKSQYSETLFNSRLFVYGMNKDGTPLTDEQRLEFDKSSEEQLQNPLTMKIDGNRSDNNSCDSLSKVNEENDKNINGDNRASHSDPLRSNATQVVRPTDNKMKRTSNEPTVTIFKKESKPPPNKTNVKPAGSQVNKDTPGSEVVFFPRVDNFEDELDDSVREFVTSLFFVLEGKRLDRSFERADKQLLLCAPFEKKDYVGIDPDSKSYRKKCQGRLRKHLADLCLLAGLPGEAILHYTTAIDILKPVNDWLWMGACYEGLCAAAIINVGWAGHANSSLRRNQSFSVKRGVTVHEKQMDKQRSGSIIHHHGSYANGLQELPKLAGKSLDTEDLVEKYKEAIGLYSKFKNAGIIEMEASFKAARILIQHKKNLQASEFLQNIVYINLQLSDEDRINRYSSLSILYSEIGFQRKASFFRRVAAMQCVAPQNPKPNWHLCHQLLVQALEGYRIYLDPKESKVKSGCINGWPVIQTRVLHELIYSARRMGNIPIAVRYTSLLLHQLLDDLSPQEKREVVSSLETLTSQTEGSTQPLALESGVIVPHIPLLNVPLVKSFKLMPLHPHLEPRKMNSTETSLDNVFIFTPMNLNAVTETNKTDLDFCWVEGDMCEIQLQVYNPMPDELKVTNMGLLSEGVELETFPLSPSIAAESGPYLVKIMAKPMSAGDLKVLGYTSKVYGVKSNCKLKDCRYIPQPHYKLNVVPALPQIQISSSLSKSASFLSFGEEFNVVTSATTVLYTGQSCECVVTIQNNGKLPVEVIKTSLECSRENKACILRGEEKWNNFRTDVIEEVFQWNKDNIESQLPLQVSSLLCFSLALSGIGDCLPLSKGGQHRSAESLHRYVSRDGKSVEALLKLEYSGGPGLGENYCRCCSIAFIIDVQPSVVFHKWEVMPSESADHCYLVFDLQNQSGQEMEVQYGSNQVVYLNNDQIRRINVQIERCQPMKTSESVKSFSQYLAKFVDIRWNIPSLNIQGKASIEHLEWTLEQQQLVYVSPVSWDIHLNGSLYSPLHIGALDYNVGETLEVRTEVNILPDITSGEGVLCIHCLQDCDNGTYEGRTSQSVVPLGAECKTFPQISAEIPISHSCMYMFACAGKYKFELSLKINHPTSIPVSTVQGTDQNRNGDSAAIHTGGRDLLTSQVTLIECGNDGESYLQIWKCSSVIEVKVTS